MHSDHNIFVRAISEKRKVRTTYFDAGQAEFRARVLIPVSYSLGWAVGEDFNHYHFWTSESEVDRLSLVLCPDKIAAMELADEKFDPAELAADTLSEAHRTVKQDGEKSGLKANPEEFGEG